MSTNPQGLLLSPMAGDLYAPTWAGIYKQLPGYCDVDFDYAMGNEGDFFFTQTLGPSGSGSEFALKLPCNINTDADYLAREMYISPIAGSAVGPSGAINPQDLKVRIRDGDGNAITSDWITANDLCGPLGPCALPFRKGGNVTIDLWNQGDGTLVVAAGFKGWKRFPCNETQGQLPPFIPQRHRFCKEWAGVKFEEYEYFFEFTNGAASTFASLLISSEAGAIQFTAAIAGGAGNSITVAIVAGAGASPTISVAGNAITFTQNAGNSGTQQQFLNLLNSDPAATALVSGAGVNNPNAPMPLQAATPLAGGSSSTVAPWVTNLQPQSPNNIFAKFALPTDNDADFLWRGTTGMIMSASGPIAQVPDAWFLLFYDIDQIPLANTVPHPGINPTPSGPSAEMVISSGGGRMAPHWPEILIPRGRPILVDILLQTPATGLSSVQFSLRGFKVYDEGNCEL
jgi:hypothetical protein